MMSTFSQRPYLVSAWTSWFARFSVLAAAAAGSACGDVATLSVADGTGPAPRLPPPNPSLIPIVDIAPAVGWERGQTPETASGFSVTAYATGLAHPRWLYRLPNGDVLVAETAAPPADGIGGP